MSKLKEFILNNRIFSKCSKEEQNEILSELERVERIEKMEKAIDKFVMSWTLINLNDSITEEQLERVVSKR